MQELVTFQGDRLAVRFDQFGLDRYDAFLRLKKLPETDIQVNEDLHYTITAPARFASLLGVEMPRPSAPGLTIAEHLFDDQRAVLEQSLAVKRFAIWCDCGWGKTPVGLEWGRHVAHRTSGRVLITTLNDIVPQWGQEAAKFYGDGLRLHALKSRDEMKQWCKEGCACGCSLAVTNYEKWNPKKGEDQVVHEAKHLAGIILDEGSRLRTQGGKQKWALIKSCDSIEYKLVLTATPAPNDVFEFASQAGFLNKFRSENSINAYWRRDPKTHRWTIKEHARDAFFAFMAAWSIYIRDPRRYGWRLDMAEVPKPIIHLHELPMTEEQRALLPIVAAGPDGEPALIADDSDCEFNAIVGNKVSQLAKGFLYRTEGKKRLADPVASAKPGFVADLAVQEAARGEGAVLIWTVFDEEAEILSGLLKGRVEHACLTGKTTPKRRQEILAAFRAGELPVLLSRDKVLGFGLNLQIVGSMIFSGWGYGYEAYYQALRRAYRQGQTRQLRVHLPVIRALEGDMLDTIFVKQDQHEAAIAEMERCYIETRKQLGGAA